MQTRSILTALVVGAAVGLTACGDPDRPVGPDDSYPTRSDDTPGAGAEDPALAAIAVAEEAGDGQAYGIDDEGEDGTWEVEVASGDNSVEVTVTEDGTPTVGEQEELDAQDREALEAASVDLTDAIETARGDGDAALEEAGLEHEDGAVWVVELEPREGDDATRVVIDPTSGEQVSPTG